MTNALDIVFILQFLISIGIFLLMVYNVLHKCEKYDLRKGWLFLIGWFLAWGVGIITTMHLYTSLFTQTTFYIQLFKLETYLMPFVALLFIIQLAFLIAKAAQPSRKAYNSIKQRGAGNGG